VSNKKFNLEPALIVTFVWAFVTVSTEQATIRIGPKDCTGVFLGCETLKGGRNSNSSARWINDPQADEIFHHLYDVVIGLVRHHGDERAGCFLNRG